MAHADVEQDSDHMQLNKRRTCYPFHLTLSMFTVRSA